VSITVNDILKPSVYMVAGCNGAGKTTAIMTLLPDYLNICNFLNADEIARGLSPLNPQSAVIDAGRLMLQQLDKIILQKKDFAFETTASGLGHIKTLKKCLSAGYKIHIIYLYLHN
jgi:predicted ABC-type ATPase